MSDMDSIWKTDPLRQAKFSTQRLGQLCFFGISKIEAAMAEALYDEGVEPEKRVKVKEIMRRRLEDIAQDLIVEAINKGMLNEQRLRETLKGKGKKVRKIIIEKEDGE